MQERYEIGNRSLQKLGSNDWVPALGPSNLSYSEPVTGDDWHLRDYLRAIRRRLWLVAGIATLVTTSVGLYMVFKPDLYEAQAEVQVDLENTNTTLGSTKNTSVIVSNPLNDPAYFGTQLQVLSGPRLLQRVIKTLDLERHQWVSVPGKKPWEKLKHLAGIGAQDLKNIGSGTSNELPITSEVPTTTSPEEMAEATRLAPLVLAIQENLTTEPVKESRLPNKTTRLINISFENPNPTIAAKLVNTLADTYVLYNLEAIRGTNETTSQFLQKQIAELQVKIRSGEERLIDYSKSNQILSLDASQNTTVERLTGLNQQLLQAENERKTAESAYRASLEPGAAEAMAESNYSQIPGVETTAAAQIGKAESKLAELRQRRAELLVENTEEWPEVKQLDQQIAVLEKQAKESRDRAALIVKTNLATRYRQTLAREQALGLAFSQQRSETVAQNEAAINYRIIQQEIETNKSLLDSLLQRSKQNDISMAGTQNNIHVINYAVTPTEPVGPRRLLNTFLALVFSLAFAIGLALLLEYLDDTIRTPDDVDKTLGLTTLSLIPSVRGRLRPHVLSASREEVSNRAHPELLLSTGGNQSLLAEAYRHLRTSMLLSPEGSPPKTLLVTSSQPNEGKTTTTINTAISLAQTGASVLLIDADMHRPSLHKIFGLENERGLSTILASEVGELNTFELIEQNQENGISLLTAGPVPSNPAELLCKERMRHLIDDLRPHFRYIIIDSPPIMSFTDSVIISSMVDGVLLVVGSKISRDVARCSSQILSRAGAKIFGVILNNVIPSLNDYFYFQRYKGLY